ncbi:WD40 repeat domain-containing protein [Paenibacillus sp. B2(2019)]|uniref:WD40 repeat domain-containing protein n=1 Tax=Paenibacillus sp. B2(2019) TaxID=2607754 RepID=UPI0011F122DB|nr:WD40 repeat domain-containing protein [Paenibacillus sp. B2(2019)]KAA1190770.1 WD40 repeat domain-containing protein [Paenibacillus sp. B2(2019)]
MKALRIGEPLNGLAVWASAYGTWQGADRIYAVSSGSPCILFVLDPSGEQAVERYALEGSDHCWGVVLTTGGVYIGGSGILYRYTYENGVENLGEMIPGEFYTWRLAADTQGRIYGGCYPGGKVFQYDPATGVFRDYGVMVAGEQYARSMEAWNGKLYVGVGTQTPHIVVLDTETGERSEIRLPDECKGEQLVYDLNIVQGKLFARITPSARLYIYDLELQEWGDTVDHVSGLSVSPPDELGNVYFIKDDYLQRYDVRTGSLFVTSLAMPEPAGDYGWLNNHALNRKERCLTGVYRDGSCWIYDPATDRYTVKDFGLQGQSVHLQSMTYGPDDALYIGGYFAGGLSRFDKAADEIISYRGIGQTEGMLAGSDCLYLGVYPRANIFKYDPNEDWKPGENPELLFSLQEEEQDRPFAWAWAGEELAIGTVPSYGRHGGALTLYNPASGAREVFRNLLPQQSVVSLTCRDQLLFAGGSVWGGLGIAPQRADASLMIWDLEKRCKVWEGVAVQGERAISALVLDDAGYLWGLTAGKLFWFDPQLKLTVKTYSLFSMDWNVVTHFWRSGNELLYKEGMLYGVSMNRLFKFNMRNEELEVLDDDARLLAMDREGDLFFARTTALYRMHK